FSCNSKLLKGGHGLGSSCQKRVTALACRPSRSKIPLCSLVRRFHLGQPGKPAHLWGHRAVRARGTSELSRGFQPGIARSEAGGRHGSRQELERTVLWRNCSGPCPADRGVPKALSVLPASWSQHRT